MKLSQHITKLNFTVNTLLYSSSRFILSIPLFYRDKNFISSCLSFLNVIHSPFPLQPSCYTPRFHPYLFSFVSLYSNYPFRYLPSLQSNDHTEGCLHFFVYQYPLPHPLVESRSLNIYLSCLLCLFFLVSQYL